MARNILIFSDGTGQAGGLMPDEARSNVYKLYRATRCGPDSPVDPARQLAFCDPGLGSQSEGSDVKLGWARWFRNLLAQGTGLGITDNIVDCYAAIVRLWAPGDRIYLFGFSRGAYTIRCVGGVLSLCGVPTRMEDGSPLRRDAKSARAVAAKAVKDVYKYGSSIDGDPFKEERRKRAADFRRDHGSAEGDHANVYPYFIGVFDTVAALGVAPAIRIILAGTGAVVAAALALLLSWLLAGTILSFLGWLLVIAAGICLAFLVPYLWTHLTFHPTTRRPYLSSWSMRFYDERLDRRVGFARHALSIDEDRVDFNRVKWHFVGNECERGEHDPEPLRQVWFAGNHSDVGGSYEENESRLSDISLQWMREQLDELPDPVLINESVFRLYPSAEGPQHDQAKKGFPGLLGRVFHWHTEPRKTDPDAPLHPSVTDRFKAGSVLQYDLTAPYRPAALKPHKDVAGFY